MYPHHCLLHVLGLPDVLVDEPAVADQPHGAGVSLFHVQEEGCEEEQSWGRRASLGHVGQGRSRATPPPPSPLVALVVLWRGCREAEEVSWRRCSLGFPCRWCVPRGHMATSLPGLSPPAPAGSGAMLPAEPGASPPAPCQEQLRPSRALRGIPACSIPQRMAAPATAPAQGSPATTAFPVPPARRCPGHFSDGRPLCPTAAYPGKRASPLQSPQRILLPRCPPGHYACAQSPECSPCPWDGHGEMRGRPRPLAVATSNQTTAALGLRCPHGGLISWGAHAGDTLAVWARCLLPTQRPVLPAATPPFQLRTHCSAPCSAGGFGPASSTLAPAAALQLPSPFHGGRRWRGLPASCPAGMGGPGVPRGGHGTVLRLRHGRPSQAARFPVVSPLTFEQNLSRGPGPGGQLPASGRFLPWLREREGRPRAPCGAAHLPSGLSARDLGGQSLGCARPGLKAALGEEEMASVALEP